MKDCCARCGADLRGIDGELAAFCPACGLAQLRVLPEAVASAYDAAQGKDTADGQRVERPLLDWDAALRIAAAVSVVGALLPSALPGAVAAGTAGGMSLLLMPLLTLAAVSLYHRSRPRRDVTPTIGGRLGAVLGMMVGFGIAAITGVVGFVLRYRYHSHAMDDAFRASYDTMMARLQEATPPPPDVVGFLRSPEFRAGTLILGHVLSLLLLVLAGTLCGWLAGALLRSRRERMVR